MARGKVFASPQSIYWPGEYSYIVDALKGIGPEGKPAEPAYRYNTGVILLAAVVGLVNERQRDVGTNRQEIAGETFEAQRLGTTQSPLAAFVLLIGLLAHNDVELLRPEREGELVRTFERYASGGLEVLAGLLATSSGGTVHDVLQAEINRALVTLSTLQIEAASNSES